jgi:hypothetical protein
MGSLETMDETGGIMDERGRLIRLNGDEGSSSQGSSQGSMASFGFIPDIEGFESDLRRVKVSAYSLVFLFFSCFIFSVYLIKWTRTL